MGAAPRWGGKEGCTQAGGSAGDVLAPWSCLASLSDIKIQGRTAMELDEKERLEVSGTSALRFLVSSGSDDVVSLSAQHR